jgi:prokaryotic ubiquitin-like protein Pup
MNMEQARKSRSEKPQVKDAGSVSPKVDPTIEAHKSITDELLDEIDALLEENAQEFVANYVQRGGQ